MPQPKNNQPKQSSSKKQKMTRIDVLIVPGKALRLEVKPIGFNSMVRGLQDDTHFDFDAYISGKMTGLPDHNFPAFNRLSSKLRNCCVRVFNPAENFDGDKSRTTATYLRKDIKAVARSGAIIMLPSWSNNSQGAYLELFNALHFDCDVYFQDEANKNQFYKLINHRYELN